MEAVPRLPMISFQLKTSTENASFSQPLKQYIAQFYGEDPESYNNEIHNLECLRGAAIRPTVDVEGIQLLKKYYCQLHFLKSRFPMEEMQPVSVYFSWKDNYSTLACSIPDIRFELMCILYNIGALHTQLGAMDQRTTPDGMKIACTHFQCAAWAFQTLRENYYQMVTYISTVEVVQFMELVCLAQSQECILEKSMMDNRKATIIAKVAVQVEDYYRKAQITLQGGVDENNYSDYVQVGIFKEWVKYLNFKVAYHKCISLLFQGQQAEEMQKMGERVALYQAAADQLETARKLSTSLENKQDIAEALAFTSDFVEGKKKAAKNENDFIYHEQVPNMDNFPDIKGASLVKGIPFSITDVEVSGADIFARLVPMEAHEASSLYSERKAELLRKYGELIENKDQKLAEFMSSMQMEFMNDMRQATGLPQDLVDRAAALSAKPNAIQDLISSMTKLSNSYQEVESLLGEIQELLKEEEQSEKEYQKSMGERPPSIIATDLSREAAKYREAHNKANDSNQNLHKAMVTHVGNLKTLSQPLKQQQQQIPSIKFPDPNIDEAALKEIEMLLGKIEEMRTQRGVLWAQLRDALHKDDVTSVLVTRPSDQSIDDIFKQELDKHQQLTSLIEQNANAQENIIKAFIDAYARFSNTRRYLQGIIMKRQTTINSLISSYDSYEDLLAKANKGIEFYGKLETNVTKLLQRIKSACKVQQEEREQMLAKIPTYKKQESAPKEPNTPKLKDYLDSMKNNSAAASTNQLYSSSKYAGNVLTSDGQVWPPGVRPTPVGSEINDVQMVKYDTSVDQSTKTAVDGYYAQNRTSYAKENYNLPQYGAQQQLSSIRFDAQQSQSQLGADTGYALDKRLSALSMSDKSGNPAIPYQQYAGYNYVPYYNYASSSDAQVPNTQENSIQHPSGYSAAAATSNSALYMAQHSQYIPTHYQQMNYPSTQAGYGQNASNHVYASGYATSQNFQNSGMATVQSGGYVNYGSGASSQTAQRSNIYSGFHAGAGKDSQPNTGTNIIHSSNQSGLTGSYGSSGINTTPQSYQIQSGITQPPASLHSSSYTYDVNSVPGYGNNPSVQTVPQMTVSPSAESLTGAGGVPQSFPYAANYLSSTSGGPQSYQLFEGGSAMQQNSALLNQPSALSQYSEGYVGAGSLTGPNQINPSYMYTQAEMNYSYNTNNTLSSNGGLTSPQCLPNNQAAAADYSYISNASQSKNEVVAFSQTKKQQSATIDLLSGLEFSISQVPLKPEQKKIETVDVEQVSKPSTGPKEPSSLENIQGAAKTVPIAKTVEKVIQSKGLDNEEVKKLFRHEIDKYDKFVDFLSSKTLNGPTTLDLKWKEIQDQQESEGMKRIISVARCYPMKNRFPDILPYDHSRVVLGSRDDDYINASYIKDISPFVPPVIITQAPLQSTVVEFWTMLLEQRVEFVMCLLSDSEIGSDIYWPTERGKDINVSNIVISLQSIIVKDHWIERLITISIPEKREFSTIVHLQFTDWPASSFPSSPSPFVSYIRQFITLYQQQRLHSNPMVIHCSSGIGRSGVACLLVFAILEATNNSATLPDLTSLTNKITSFRKNILRDREHLKFAYQAFMIYMKLTINGNLPKLAESPVQDDTSSNSTKNDPLSSLDPFWASRKDKK